MIELRKPAAEDAAQIVSLISNISSRDSKASGGFPGARILIEDGLEAWIQFHNDILSGKNLTYYEFMVRFSYNENSEIVGYIMTLMSSDELSPDFKEGVVNYYIAPQFRSQKYGEEQFKAFLPEMREAGFTEFNVQADVDNTASVKLLENCGGIFQEKLFSLRESCLYAIYHFSV